MNHNKAVGIVLVAAYFFVVGFGFLRLAEEAPYMDECNAVCVAEGWDFAEKLSRVGIEENLCACVRINEMNHRENAKFARWK